MERRTNNYDVKFGRIRINFDKIEVQPGKYYTRDESDAIFLKVSEITRYIDFNKPDFNPTEELVNVYINGRGYKIPETKIDNDTIKKNSEGQLYADIKQTKYIAGKNITLTDKEDNIKEISAGTDESVTSAITSLREDLDTAEDNINGHELRITTLENSKLTESDTITIKTDNYLTIDYNSENKHLSLKDKKGNIVSEIDASVFVKDGMLDSVELYSIGDDTYLRFVFNTTSGKEDINVKVTELIDIYDGQGCIDITDKIISLKYDSSKLSVNTQGNLTLTEDYLKNISKGTDGTYVTTEISQKSNGNQTIGTSVKVQAISSANEANNGLVEAKDVKEYVTNQINAIPKEKCLPLVDDLDNYDCPVGTIVKYNGETNDKYVNGWDYIKTVPEGGQVIIPTGSLIWYVSPKAKIDDLQLKEKINKDPYFYNESTIELWKHKYNNNLVFSDFDENEMLPKIGSYIAFNVGNYTTSIKIGKITSIEDRNYYYKAITDNGSASIYKEYMQKKECQLLTNSNGVRIYKTYWHNPDVTPTYPNKDNLEPGLFIIKENGDFIQLDASDEDSGIFKSADIINVDIVSWKQHNAQPDISGQVSNLETTVATNSQNILSLQSGKQDKITETNKLSYDLLKDTPTIPTVPTKLSEFTDDLSVGKNPTHTHNQYLTEHQDISGKADASTWSANLKTQIDSDHTTLSGLSSKWTDILKSQIDADHTTLGTLSGYLTSAKRTSIDDAISKSHTQNTDTMLASGKLKVESNKISATLPIVSSGDIQGTDVSGTMHLLSKKMDSAMFRTYNSFADMVADTQRPAGCWCAIIE